MSFALTPLGRKQREGFLGKGESARGIETPLNRFSIASSILKNLGYSPADFDGAAYGRLENEKTFQSICLEISSAPEIGKNELGSMETGSDLLEKLKELSEKNPKFRRILTIIDNMSG